MTILNECKVSKLLAYISTVYIMASAIYLVITHWYGTPLRDALQQYPNLVKIKQQSGHKRKMAFMMGIVISIIILFIWRPFEYCSCAV